MENNKLLQSLKSRTAAKELLWHYTTWEGLEGILRNREIWLSHAYYLNDSRELQHGFELFLRLIKGTPHDWLSELLRTSFSSPLSIYVASLSNECDDLSQWRGYGGRERGFALAFDRNRLTVFAEKHEMELSECLYEERHQKDRLAVIVKTLDETYKFALEQDPARGDESKLTPGQLGHYRYSATTGVFASLARHVVLLKDDSFRNEKEWRLHFVNITARQPRIPNLQTDLHRKGSMPVPHIALPFCGEKSPADVKHPLEAVLVGPGPHPSLAAHSVTHLLRKYQISAQVAESAVPFRTW